MKKRSSVLLAATMMCAASFAQSSQNGNEISKGWNTVYVQYNNLGASYSYSLDNDDLKKMNQLSDKLNGFSVGYNRAINITPSAPLYLEIGAALQYAFYSDDCTITDTHWVDKYKFTGSILSVKVPVSVLYHIAIPNSSFAIEPFAGVDFRYNIMGEGKETCTSTYTNPYNGNSSTYEEETKSSNIFDKDKCDGHQANRFQAGWHVGANFVYKNAFVGVSYGQDFSKFQDEIDLKFKTISATLGYRF